MCHPVVHPKKCERMRGMAPSTDGVAQRASTGCRLYLDMLGFVREKVSKNKIRFRDEQEKFDLDLTCILTRRPCVVAFPCTNTHAPFC